MGKRKRLSGIIWLIIFVSILALFSGGYSELWASVTDFTNNGVVYIKGIFGGEDYTGPRTITTQKLVEEESSIIEVVDRVSPSVVSVVVKTVDFDFFSGPTTSEEGIGTGFIVDPNGLIVTNSHVVNNVQGEYSVVLKDGQVYEVNKIHLDELSDIAILEITARDLTAVEFGDSDSLKVGQRAIAIGNALGRFQNTVTSGIVSGISRELTASSGFGGRVNTYEGAIQTDAALNPGNSGGPLLNSSGQVIGVNVATTAGADNISFAIPINTLKPILQSFLDEGRIVRPFIGITYTIISEELSVLRGMPQGAFISRVTPGSPADGAGLRRGDIITKFDGKEINEDFSLARAVIGKKVGDKVILEVDRSGDVLTVNVVLEEAPDTFQ